MLILSRKIGERIAIGHNITVTITQIREGSVRVGIEAPDDVRILRDDAVKQERGEP